MRNALTIGVVAAFVLAGFSMIPRAFTVGEVFAQDDIAKHASCPYCGMDRAKFAHARIYMEYDDGSTVGTCSLHCAAIDMALNIDKTPKAIMVGDYDSSAYWVIGGKKMGVMTARAKWAFEKKAGADLFINGQGGRPATFDDAISAAFEDMYDDVKMIRKKRQMMRMKKIKPKG